MPFISEILKYKSLSVVGLEKNVGKTVTLNYILRRLAEYDRQISVTSIGIDGESKDQVTATAKPEIVIGEGMVFSTSEQHFFKKEVIAEILSLSKNRTSLGRLVTARSQSTGRVLLSGPADTRNLIDLIENDRRLGVDLSLVDGALSRLSLASPSVTESMILATGAAYSLNISQLIKGTAFVCRLIDLDKTDEKTFSLLAPLERGVYVVDDDAEIHKLPILSAIMFASCKESFNKYGHRLFVAGVLTDKLVDYIRMQKWCEGYEIIVQDFTKLFLSPEVFAAFTRKGGRISVLYRTNLIAVTVNPTSPKGYSLNSELLTAELSETLHRPVFDVMKLTDC